MLLGAVFVVWSLRWLGEKSWKRWVSFWPPGSWVMVWEEDRKLLAMHAARIYLRDLGPGKAVLKLDFRNAFNTIHRDKMLSAVLEHAPCLHPFLQSAYTSPSSLFWSDKIIQSAERLQQGDPLGPLLSYLCIHHMSTLLRSELSFFYLDDSTMGGSVVDLSHDLEIVE